MLLSSKGALFVILRMYLISMRDIVDAFDREFDSMARSEILFAEAVAHMLDRDTAVYVDSLTDAVAASQAAADAAHSYE